MGRKVIFIHGMFMTWRCWESWIERYAAAGYECAAPPWPGREIPVEELRARHPDPELAKLTLDRVVDHYEQFIRRLEGDAPVLIGHSMGGLIVQLLLARGLGERGVAIDSAPPKGVLSLKWSFLKSNWPVISPFANKKEPYLMPFKNFHYTFAHTTPAAELRAVYDRHVVPESRLVGNGPTTAVAKIDYTKPRAPLLMIAGELDHIIPASLNRANFARYAKTPARTDFHEFPGRTHYILGQGKWTEVADFIDEWIKKTPAQ